VGLVVDSSSSERTSHEQGAAAMGLYIFAACFVTSSATFANPAVTIARSFTNSFTGIAPSSVPLYIAGQVIGGILGAALTVLLYPRRSRPTN